MYTYMCVCKYIKFGSPLQVVEQVWYSDKKLTVIIISLHIDSV